ncbi:Asp-tRNA(Asn)/Glu-tRNA(Gln) amidotransferase subunit GatB [Patescibacteria group bacterium]|nr:Asp-tRNA(Asn)/Glu-tRNA(Gln) amidotransferase subunit GatB [Patescibacteria group bacterium]MBU1448944.1 Asp-tRNA(Asn)/Glu-tRNA(Gln) amidotransferase subunit GatB [Patescibacteria group bacterium]MBU2612894.1 Asp-tRNA(Asn)/Glu-tRNA(Gln) amidotransferase subunit GatB [Patescibacteria group bacterium]
MRLIPIIGLEVHVQLKTASKMFCPCPNVGDEISPNTAICPICTGQPGALPALNATALELGVKTALALHCRVPDTSAFDRKNYFYPDLPKGYQISQFRLPIALDGHVEADVPKQDPPRDRIRVGITRAHLEEDAAKNFHTPDGTAVDFNRSGTPLLEIVSEPDLRSPQEAKAYLQEIRSILRAIGASDADMEKGQMRCDANVSLLEVDDKNMPTQSFLNPKIEIKNLNSFRAVERALTHEIERQNDLYASNTPPVGATRGWDEDAGATFEQRTKESSADYRYFPEPDLPPQDLVAIRERMQTRSIELPSEKRSRLEEEWWFSKGDVAFLVGNDGWADYAENVMGELGAWLEATDGSSRSGGELLNERKKKLAKLAGGWLTTKLAGLLATRNMSIADVNITPEDFAEFLHLLDGGKINSANGQKLLALMVETGTDPSHLMENHGLGQTMDADAVTEVVRRIIEQNPDQVAQVKAGKTGVIGWFVGGVMKTTEGKANPVTVEEIVRKELGD